MIKLYALAILMIYSSSSIAVNDPPEVYAGEEMPISTPEVVNPDPEISPPVRISGNSPAYPISLLLTGMKGYATINFIIGTDGVPKNFKVVKATNTKFSDHAIISIREWRFTPAMKGNIPIEVEFEQTFDFSVE